MNLDQSMLQWAVQVGGPMAALFLIGGYFYRRDLMSFTEQWKGQSEQLITVVKENTASNTKLITLIDAMHRRLDGEPWPGRSYPRE